MILGIDVSHWDGKIDWTQVPSEYKFAFIKASEPGYIPDAQFVANWQNCKIPKGAYHFWRYAVDDAKQARDFFSVAGGGSDLPPVCDIEDPKAPKMASDMAYRIKGFLTNVEGLFKRRPIIYTGAWWTNATLPTFAAFADYPLWLADYTYLQTGGPRHLPKGCSKWLIHQYTDRGQVPGINAMVDLNVLNGTLEDLVGSKPPLTTDQKINMMWEWYVQTHEQS